MTSESMRVLHVIARMNIGGTARYLSDLLPDLNSKDINTQLAVGRVQNGEIEDSSLAQLNFTRIESLGRRISLFADINSYFKLRRAVNRYKPDVIHTHTFKAGVLCRLMYPAIPKVHTFHGHLLTDPEFSEVQRKVIVNIERVLALFTRKIVVTGAQVAVDLLSLGIGSPSKYVSIPGQIYPISSLPRGAARVNLGLGNEFTILWSARVVPVKNPKLLVQVAMMMPECRFIMAGDGVDLDSIIELAPPNLNILGFVDVKEILLAADVFLSTSLNEGIPYSILEAQSVNLPVVAVKAGALSEIIKDGVNGYLVEPHAEVIVSKIQKLMSNPELMDSMKSSSRDMSLSHQSEISFATKHVELYKEILSKK